jgi:Fe-S-cluster containining protein
LIASVRRLALLQDAVHATVARVVSEKPDWPCRRGCDHCCRSLATPMRISRVEWDQLATAIAALDNVVQREIAARLDEPRVCALLDRANGACRVYEARPIACRAYGFYFGRDGGRYCGTIHDSDCTDGVVLGNHDALERALDALGETRTLTEWMSS